MIVMIKRLFTTRRGNWSINLAATAIGLVLVVAIDSPRDGTILFLSVTAVESGTFSLIYGLRSDWRREPAARAVFWAVFAYAALALHLLLGFLFPYRFTWWDDVRELLYLSLSIAGLNLVLTVVRVLGRRVYSRRG